MTERQLMLITDFRPDLIACTPSYALTLAQAFRERGVAPEEISLRYAVLGAEPWTEAMRSEIDARLGVRSTNIFGLSEVIGPGVSCECVEEREEFLGDGELRARAEARLRESIGCSLAVTLSAPGSVPRSEGGKLQRVMDRRKLET